MLIKYIHRSLNVTYNSVMRRTCAREILRLHGQVIRPISRLNEWGNRTDMSHWAHSAETAVEWQLDVIDIYL